MEKDKTLQSYDVFISWRNDANEVGKRIANRLKTFIEDVFVSTITAFASDVDLKEEWNKELEYALNTSEYGILILTPEAMDSFWMSYEYGVLKGRGKKIRTFHFSKINREITPFTIHQDKEFNQQTLYDFLKEIYGLKYPQVNDYDKFKKQFNNLWKELNNDIALYINDINKNYKRKHILCKDFESFIRETDTEKEKLHNEIQKSNETIKSLNIEIDSLKRKNETLSDNINTNKDELFKKILKLNDELAEKQHRIDVLENNKKDITNLKQMLSVEKEKNKKLEIVIKQLKDDLKLKGYKIQENQTADGVLEFKIRYESFNMIFVKGNNKNNDFYIGETQVTQGLWKVIMDDGKNPSDNQVGDDYPVENVTYNTIVNVFLPKLSKLTSKTFRLPTSKEWEYAAHSGNIKEKFLYSGDNDYRNVAWCTENSNGSTHPVKSKGMNPNGLGVYGMSGNVWEWCSDYYPSGIDHILRGGSWKEYCCFSQISSSPSHLNPNKGKNDVGFRLVLSVI